MTKQKFDRSRGTAHAIPYGVAVHLTLGSSQRPEYVGGFAHEYRIGIDPDGPGQWLVILELMLPSGPTAGRTIRTKTLAEACGIAMDLRKEMKLAFATIGADL